MMCPLLMALSLLLLISHTSSTTLTQAELYQAKVDFEFFSDASSLSFEQPHYVGSWVMQICFCLYSTDQGRPSNLRTGWRDLIVGTINRSLFGGNPGSCKAFVKFLLKGQYQLDHVVELQFIFFFASIFAKKRKWSLSVWTRLAYISSQGWNLMVSFSSTNNNNNNN